MNAAARLEETMRILEQVRDDIIESWGYDDVRERAQVLLSALTSIQDATVNVAIVKTEVEARAQIAEVQQ